MESGRIALWSLGPADSVTVKDPSSGQFQRYPIRAELASDAEGKQLYLVRLGGRKRARSTFKQGTAAAKAYRARYGRDPADVRMNRIEISGKARSLGPMFAIRYYDQNGTLRHHDFSAPRPYLTEYENGQLLIHGGSYRTTERGIVG